MKRIEFGLLATVVLLLGGCSVNDVASVQQGTSQPSVSQTNARATETESAGPSEAELRGLLAADLANSLVFTFDNFQCWEGNDCKAIYEIRYFGGRNTHEVSELYFSEVNGFISSASGNKAKVGIIAIQDSAGLAYGYLEQGVAYTAIINTSSVVNEEYDSIYLESHGEVLLDDYFGCFKSEARLISATPTC